MKAKTENIRIKDIAKLAGVSEGTVDRVLHDRGKVSTKSREKVELALSKANYKPNIYASALASKKKLYIICIIPEFGKGDYWELVANGISKAEEEVNLFNVTIQLLYFNQFNVQSFNAALIKAVGLSPDGIIFPPFFREESVAFSDKLNESSIPYVLLDSNITTANPLAYFGQDSFRSGEIAAKLFVPLLRESESIAMFHFTRTENQSANQTISRKSGFEHFMKGNFPSINIIQIELSTTNHTQNLEVLKSAFEKQPQIGGAIVFNSLSYLVREYLQQINRTDIKLIGYDLLERSKEYLKQDAINFLIGQRPEDQGFLGVKALCDFLLFNRSPKQINYMPIDIVVKENVDYL